MAVTMTKQLCTHTYMKRNVKLNQLIMTVTLISLRLKVKSVSVTADDRDEGEESDVSGGEDGMITDGRDKQGEENGVSGSEEGMITDDRDN